MLQLAERAGLQGLVGEHVGLSKPTGVNAHLKVPNLVAGMVAGADSIDDMAVLRHGAMRRLFGGVRAPSTLGTFLRALTFGHVRQLDAVASRLLINLAGQVPLLPGAGELAFLDVDDTLRQTYGYAKQGAGRGYTGVKGLNALLAIVSTPGSAPVSQQPSQNGRVLTAGDSQQAASRPTPERPLLHSPNRDRPQEPADLCGFTNRCTRRSSSIGNAGALGQSDSSRQGRDRSAGDERDLDRLVPGGDEVEALRELSQRELMGADAVHGKAAGLDHADGGRPAVWT